MNDQSQQARSRCSFSRLVRRDPDEDEEEDPPKNAGCLLSNADEIWFTTGDVDDPDWDSEGGEFLR